MGKAIARSKQNHKAFWALLYYVLVFFVLKGSNAYEFKVGGENGWTIPNETNGINYNQWAEQNRFQIGDTLVFDYPANKDTVVQVTKEDYNNCHSATPLDLFTNGHTVFKFNHSGPYYFISGLKENCFKNQKLVVVVMADRRKRNSPSPSPSPAPSMSTVLPPSPPPINLEPITPPMGTVPASAPAIVDTTHPSSGACTIVTTLIGSIGALGVALFPFVF